MRSYFFLLVICITTSCTVFKSRSTALQAKPGDPGSLPSLTLAQMIADHDSLISYIHQVSPIIYYNKEVRGINFDSYATNLKKQITSQTSMGDYLIIVEKTLNAAQDGHSGRLGSWQLNIMRTNWIPNKLITDIDTATISLGDRYEQYVNKHFYSKLKLNLIYAEGEYYNLLPFSYKVIEYAAPMKLISCNGSPVHKYVAKQMAYVSPLRWDRTKLRGYHENFYRPVENFKGGKLSLVFIDSLQKKYHLNLAQGDSVVLRQKINRAVGYNMESDPLVTHYFNHEGLFYARMPMMIEEYGDSLARMLKPIITDNRVNAIVLDIRGNPGGSDNTYSNFLKRIVRDTLSQNVVVGRNFTPYNQKFFKINADSVENMENHSFHTPVATLKEPSMYYISIPNFKFVIPDSVNYNFKGKVYILQDRYIYSSASNLSNLAVRNNQLVSIGQTPDLLGGLQTNPTILQLPFSKIIFRIEPQIDFTNAKNPVDAFQNHVEYPVSYSINELYRRTVTDEDIFSKEFLYKSDPMFRKVLELEKDSQRK